MPDLSDLLKTERKEILPYYRTIDVEEGHVLRYVDRRERDEWYHCLDLISGK